MHIFLLVVIEKKQKYITKLTEAGRFPERDADEAE